METNQNRVLAYNLAKELDPKELNDVSGGANSWSSTHHYSGGPTGQIGSMDGKVDVSVDW